MKYWEELDAKRDELRCRVNNDSPIARIWEYIHLCEKEINELKFKLKKNICECEACPVRRGDFN